MRSPSRLIITAFFLVFIAGTAAAQTTDDYHPFLSDKFNLEIGAFWPQINFTARADGSHPEESVDYDEAFNIGDSQVAGAINFRWRFGKKWSFWGQYWGTNQSGKAVLEEDIEWENIVFKEGTFAGAGVELDIVRAFFGREFNLGPEHEFGLGAGLHYLNLGTYIEGEIITSGFSNDFYRASNSAAFPLPNIGAWYMYSWSPRWMVQARVDWLSASIGDYSGSMWDIQGGINYQAFKNIGFGLYVKGFELDVDIDRDNWHGNVDFDQWGPLFTVSATW